MNKLITKNKIVNAGIDGFKRFDSYVTLEIVAHNEVCKGTNHTVEIEYKYLDDLGNDITPKSRVFKFNTSEEINTFAAAIAPSIPTGLSHTDLSDYKVLVGAQMKMAEALEILPEDINFVEVTI